MIKKMVLRIMLGISMLISCQQNQIMDSRGPVDRKGMNRILMDEQDVLETKMGPIELDQKVHELSKDRDTIESINTWSKIKPIALSNKIENGQGILYFQNAELRKLKIKYLDENKKLLIKQIYYLKSNRVFRVFEEKRRYLENEVSLHERLTENSKDELFKFQESEKYEKHYTFVENKVIQENLSNGCAYRVEVEMNQGNYRKIIKDLIGFKILDDYQITLN